MNLCGIGCAASDGPCTKRFSITETLKFMVSPIHELQTLPSKKHQFTIHECTICYNLENAYHYTRIQTESAGKEYCYARPASYFCPFKKCSDKGVEQEGKVAKGGKESTKRILGGQGGPITTNFCLLGSAAIFIFLVQ